MTVLALTALMLIQDTPQKSEADALFSKMLSRYASAKTIRGSVEFTQSAVVDNVPRRVVINTTLQSEKPNKLHVMQTDTARRITFLAVSDGKQICYTAPQDWIDRGKPRIYEPAPADFENSLEAFAILLPDRSFPLALAIYSPKEVKRTVFRLRDLAIEGEAEVSGRNAKKVRAAYILDDGDPRINLKPSMTVAYYYITPDGDLLAVTREETVGGGQLRDESGTPVTQRSYKVSNQWLVNLRINTEIDPLLFTVPK